MGVLHEGAQLAGKSDLGWARGQQDASANSLSGNATDRHVTGCGPGRQG